MSQNSSYIKLKTYFFKAKENLQKIYSQYPIINRLLDGTLVMMGVAALTFFTIRLDVIIQAIPILKIALLSALFVLPLCFIQTRKYLWVLGLISFLAFIFTPLSLWFPSLKDVTNNFLFLAWIKFLLPVTVLLFAISLSLRSLVSKNKVMLSTVGLIALLAIAGGLYSKFEPRQFKKLSIHFKVPVVIKTGDPLADLRLNPSVHPDALKREEARLGLDKPIYRQFLLWLDGIFVRGDFGLTQQGEKVLNVVSEPLRNTLILNIFVLLCTWLIGLPLGILAALNKDNYIDKFLLNLSSLSLTTPSFLLTIFILSFATRLGLGNIGGLVSVNFDDLTLPQKIADVSSHLILPVSILTFVSIGILIRQMRGNLLDVINEDYIKAARARGIPENKIYWQHALKNAINPLVTLLGFEFAALVSGAALTEMILAYPGIGALTLEAARKLDINLIMFNLLLGTLMLMLGNAFADWLLRKIDPRARG